MYLPKRSLPAYAFLPGRNVHPEKPGGHYYGLKIEALLGEEALVCEDFYHGVDLFNHGFFWEAHVWWEALWNALGRVGDEAVLLKALIKLAAAGLKRALGQEDIALKHHARAVEILEAVKQEYELDLDRLRSARDLNAVLSLKIDAETGYFGAGCFWGVEAAFRKVDGVLDTAVGYQGGSGPADYGSVCAGTTGHAEVVKVVFHPKIVSYRRLLELFWGIHDPTTVDRQGPDVGSQYRSVIFVDNERQRSLALKVKQEMAGRFSGPIVTQIADKAPFHRAEECHQRYFE